MADVKHSPGPWHWDDNDGALALNRRLLDSHGLAVADGNWGVSVRNPVDAALIASAPEMLAMLRTWMADLDESPRSCCPVSIDSPGSHAEDCVYGQTKALLARLDGKAAP